MKNHSEIDLRRIYLIIRHWWWLIVGCALISAVMVFVYKTYQDPKYEATALLLVSPGQNSQVNEYSTLVAGEKLALTYMEMLKGDTILESIISQLGLPVSLKELTEQIQVETVPGTQLIRLTVENTSPTQVALLANTIAETFISHAQKLQTDRYSSSLASQQKAMDAVMAASQETQDEIDHLNASKISDEAKLDLLEKQASLQHSELQSLERDYQDFQFNAAQLTDIVKVIESAQVPTNENTLPYQATTVLLIGNAQDSGSGEYLTGFTSDQLTQTFREILTGRSVLIPVIERLGLQETYQSLVGKIQVTPIQGTKLIRLTVNDNDSARAVMIADTSVEVFLENLKSLLEEPHMTRLANIQEEIDSLSLQIEETQKEIDKRITSKAQTEMELARQQNLLLEQRNNYQVLQNFYEQLSLTLTNNSESVAIVEPAKVPEKSVDSNKLLFTTLAGFLGALVAIAIASLNEYTNGTLQTPVDIVQSLDLTVLGSVGRLSDKESKLVVVSQPRSPNTETFRRLATNIRHERQVKSLRLLLVTSPSAQEGKSIVTANLAAALAMAELRVVVVDADLHMPQLHQLFGVPQEGGLSNVLVDEAEDVCLKQIEATKVKILTSGNLPPNPAEMLGSSRMVSLLEDLREQSDIVLIDCPPVLPVADATILASHVDGVLMVLRANQTHVQSAIEAVEGLRKVGVNIVGAILNGVPKGRGYYYYSHEEKNRVNRGSKKILTGFSNLRNRFIRKGSPPEKY